ncbi:hypothetical protein DSOL_3760 [Desulfosporosinus metallidurans]|uniref:Uncharacterized protein n=1 Tax=Desulfosporosinus metallidurans TaxID=1888891 RepID=A0A1Q8QNN0_9FIRM|nr:hypothetical protein DSOL_3760 [Desulfosporosinus metallidurans]
MGAARRGKILVNRVVGICGGVTTMDDERMAHLVKTPYGEPPR